MQWLRTPAFEQVHAGRWRHCTSGIHVETGYCYGEGVVRFYDNGDRTETSRATFRGGPEEFTNFVNMIP